MPTHELLPDVVTGCLEACRRCEAVVEAVVAQDPAAFPAVGPHLRHCVDHFRVFLDGWRTGSVNYDARSRDPRLERDPEAVGRAFVEIAGALTTIRSVDLSMAMNVVQSAAPGRPPVSSPTRLDRELAFLSGHTIHHIAIMVLAAREAGVAVPPHLARAFSTESDHETLAMTL
jgi:uncharacterized damage-inducible protein DinB